MPDQYVTTSENRLFVTNGIDPVLTFDEVGNSTLRTAGVVAPVATPTLAFSGVGTISGVYYAYMRYVDRYGNPSNLSPISLSATATVNATATYANLEVPTQTTITRRQILRNTAGQLTTFYVAIDTTNLSATSLSESLTDTLLQANEAVPLLRSDGSPNANRYYIPPADRQYAASHIGRLWLAGSPVYREGAVKLLFNSTTITGVATEWASGLNGRNLYLNNSVYGITAVDTANQILSIDRAYEGATEPYARYAIQVSDAERDLIYYSEPLLPEAFSITEALSVPYDGEEITGLMPLNSFLYILKRNAIHKFSGQDDPAKDGTIFFVNSRGCVNNRCWQIVDGTAYLLDEKGIYSFSGGDFNTLSERIRTIFSNDNDTYGIQWSSSRFFHSVHDPADGTIRWFVTMGGGYLPMHAICFNYSEGRFWVERFYRPVGGSCLGARPRSATVWQSDLRNQIYFGFDHKTVGAFKTSQLDGTAPDDLYQGTVGGSAFQTVTIPSSITAPVNAVIHIVMGKGIGQSRRIIDTLSSNRVRVMYPWTVRPDDTSIFQVGGVKFQFRTGKLFRDAGEGFVPRRFTCHWRPVQHPAYAALRAYIGWDDTAVKQSWNLSYTQGGALTTKAGVAEKGIDLADKTGEIMHNFGGHKANNARAAQTTTVDVSGCAGQEAISIRQVDLSGVQSPSQDS